MEMKMLCGSFAFTLVLGVFGSAAMAQFTVNVDFNPSGSPSGHYTGTGAAPDAGTSWNGFTVPGHNSAVTASLTSGSLLASEGTTNTGFTVTLQNFIPYDSLNDGQNAAFAPALLNDFVYITPDALLTFTLSNLPADKSYDLYLYSQNGGYNTETTQFTVGGVSQIASFNPLNSTGFVQNGNYVLYSGLTPDANGVITGTADAALAPNLAFNGLQLVAHEVVPEPAALSLLGLASLLALRPRR